MPLFHYTAVSQKGERKSGQIEIANTQALAEQLREEGFILTAAKPETVKSFGGFNFVKTLAAIKLFGGVPLVEKMLFARHLSVMVKAGFSLNKALQVLILQTKSKKFIKIITALEEDVRRGTAFGDTLAKYPDIFSDLFVNMVKVGEASGNLEGNLKLLAMQMKKDHDLQSKIKSAMMYPAVILMALFAIGTGMMIFVVPKLISIFKDLNIQLPLATRIIISLSNFLVSFWWLALIIILGIIISVRMILRTKKGKDTFNKLILKMPIFGKISREMNSARMARTLSSLIESGVSIVRALEISAGTLTNSIFSYSLIEASTKVQKGETLSKTLSNYPDLYPPIVTQMIQVGEETGTLGEISKRLAEFYEEEVTNMTKGLSAIIEPILMIVIGAAVAIFAISMLQPMYSMMGSL